MIKKLHFSYPWCNLSFQISTEILFFTKTDWDKVANSDTIRYHKPFQMSRKMFSSQPLQKSRTYSFNTRKVHCEVSLNQKRVMIGSIRTIYMKVFPFPVCISIKIIVSLQTVCIVLITASQKLISRSSLDLCSNVFLRNQSIFFVGWQNVLSSRRPLQPQSDAVENCVHFLKRKDSSISYYLPLHNAKLVIEAMIKIRATSFIVKLIVDGAGKNQRGLLLARPFQTDNYISFDNLTVSFQKLFSWRKQYQIFHVKIRKTLLKQRNSLKFVLSVINASPSLGLSSAG